MTHRIIRTDTKDVAKEIQHNIDNHNGLLVISRTNYVSESILRFSLKNHREIITALKERALILGEISETQNFIDSTIELLMRASNEIDIEVMKRTQNN